MGAAAVITRTYTPLAFKPATERWLVLVLSTIVASVWLFVIPLELLLHERGSGAVTVPAEPRR